MVEGTGVVRLRSSESIGMYRSTLTLNDEGADVVTEKQNILSGIIKNSKLISYF